MYAPAARADDWDRKTTVTFSGPVEIPGVHLTGWGVLPAGTDTLLCNELGTGPRFLDAGGLPVAMRAGYEHFNG